MSNLEIAKEITVAVINRINVTNLPAISSDISEFVCKLYTEVFQTVNNLSE